MIDEFFILHRNGLSLFHIRLDEDSFEIELSTELFAGFSSAIVAFSSELGAGHLSKIEIEDQKFVFEVMKDYITVAKISADDNEAMAEHVVSLLYREFINDYQEELKDFDGTVRKDIFFSFADKVRDIAIKCEEIAKTNPSLLANIPASIDIDIIKRLSEFSNELVDDFPDATIRLTRNFQRELPDDVMHITMFKLGKETGKDVAKKRIKKKINDKSIMKILNEISVSDCKDDKITLKICPFCRGRETDKFDCDFVAGFIEGAYNDPNITVKEISCHAVGDKNCIFKIKRR
ncbi:MAG: V4R domain-containing protein [Candidatus Heimdallarchaeota archaeon]